AIPRLSPGISHQTKLTTYARFTPSTSDYRSHLSYYRGCWHEIRRRFFYEYRHVLPSISPRPSSSFKLLYNPRSFFTHAAWLDQGCPHCPRFPTAASRRSPGRVSVPVWLAILSDQLRIVALVGLYPTNKLIRRGLIHQRKVRRAPAFPRR